MTKKQLARFGELILFEANDYRAQAQVELEKGNAIASSSYGGTSLALFSIHKAIIQLAKEAD